MKGSNKMSDMNTIVNEPEKSTDDGNSSEKSSKRGNFIRHIVEEDLESGKHEQIVTRFPPEPNGYIHIGHAKAICLNFGLAKDYNGKCHLRFDDTNPEKEDVEYVDSIKNDVKWLGWDWDDNLFFASDYFPRLYGYAEELIEAGKAYVCKLTAEELIEYRGNLTSPGKNSPRRDSSPEENLQLFREMRDGKFVEGECVLRAKIDMASPNMHMRDPVLYRIRNVIHHRTGDQWCIYPTYDYTHCISDAIEGITHSLCSLEFEVHRPLYDWVVDNISIASKPRQIEFARLNLNFTVMSKRKLLQLVENKLVNGWDDPRLPTIAGLRRRGYTPASIVNFCEEIGLSKADSVVDVGMLESAVRNDLNTTARRVMGVIDPLKVTITNYPEGQTEELDAQYMPDDREAFGTRKVPFSRNLYIEREDFMEEPFKKFFRLSPGNEVRLRWAYILKCNEVVKNDKGNIVELKCTYDPETRGGNPSDGRKIKGTIHWVSADDSVKAEVRLYERLFCDVSPDSGKKDFIKCLNPASVEILKNCYVERSLGEAKPGERFQFERKGYFIVEPVDSKPGNLVFNRIVTLRDSWANILKAQADSEAGAKAFAEKKARNALKFANKSGNNEKHD
jgi:glutaminyl-tRNA synthetase